MSDETNEPHPAAVAARNDLKGARVLPRATFDRDLGASVRGARPTERGRLVGHVRLWTNAADVAADLGVPKPADLADAAPMGFSIQVHELRDSEIRFGSSWRDRAGEWQLSMRDGLLNPSQLKSDPVEALWGAIERGCADFGFEGVERPARDMFDRPST